MRRDEAERRVLVAAHRDAEVHQRERPGQTADDLWAATRWELIINEPELVDAALELGDMAGHLYREALRATTRVLAQLVRIRIEHWLDLAVAPDYRGALTAAQVHHFNAKLSVPDQAFLIRAGGADVVAAYTKLRPR